VEKVEADMFSPWMGGYFGEPDLVVMEDVEPAVQMWLATFFALSVLAQFKLVVKHSEIAKELDKGLISSSQGVVFSSK
jgi:hypothetical protein